MSIINGELTSALEKLNPYGYNKDKAMSLNQKTGQKSQMQQQQYSPRQQQFHEKNQKQFHEKLQKLRVGGTGGPGYP